MNIDFSKYGYKISKNTIEFVCHKELYDNLEPFESVYVTGSFNGWLATGDSAWRMEKKVEKGQHLFVLSKELSSIRVPGNSGLPEFRFFALSESSYHMLEIPSQVKNVFLENMLVIDSKEDAELAEYLESCADVYRNLSDFDLDCPACRAEISNVRLVPGTKSLFRGYHPFKRSRPQLDTEFQRLKLVQKAFDLYGIKSLISLSGYELPCSRDGESMPEIIAGIDANNNHLSVNIEYNLVYFHPDAAEYLSTLQKIGHFIIDHPGPYYLHCRLGSDRTGVTSAVFAALCGASWKQIVEDYEKTAKCGIGEYRNRQLLRYSLHRLTGYDPSGVDNLAYVMQSLFLKENILSASEIEKVIERLNTKPRKKETDFFNFDGKHICGKH